MDKNAEGRSGFPQTLVFKWPRAVLGFA
jgi:hypothetical protein